MYLNFLNNKKKVIFILKKKFHKNKYENKLYYNYVKRILFIKIKFFNIKCLYLKKKNNKNFFFYYFYNNFIVKLNNVLNYINVTNFSLSILNIYLNNSIIFLYTYSKYLNIYLNFTKLFLKINNIIINLYLICFNFLFINIKKKIKNKNLIILYFILYKNYFLINDVNKIYYLFILKIKIFHFSNKNYSNEIFKNVVLNNYLIILSKVFTKIFSKKNVIFQKYYFYINKIVNLNINLNINIKTKKISCIHKIIFVNFYYNNIIYFKKNIFNSLCYL